VEIANTMTEIPYPEPGITEETRQMYPDNYSDKMGKVFTNMIDEIVRPNHVPRPEPVDHSILLDELVLMYDAHMTIGGEQNRFNASVIKAAINVIRAL
jgi:hypothetical protein